MSPTAPSNTYVATLARIVDALRPGPRTRAEVAEATDTHHTRVYHILTALLESGHVTISKRKTGGRPQFVYQLAKEPEAKPQPAATAEPAPDNYESTSGTFVLATVPSTETVPCAREPRTVALAACLDGYVDATATGRKSPCNQCPTGRARRAAYAGSDFEESDDE